MRRPLALAAVLLLAAPAGASTATTKTVELEDVRFKPSTVRITKGSTVTWRFVDGGLRHDVTSTGSRRFRSSAGKTRGSHRVRFRRAGTYRYFCSFHPGTMKGKVVVR